jgi:hypothetical protein
MLLVLSIVGGLFLVVVAAMRPSASTSDPSFTASIDPSKYTALCASALTQVQFATHEIEDANLTPNDPAVIQAGPPPRLQCGISEGTYIGAVTFDAACVRVTAAVMDGRVIYISDDARSAMTAAAKSSRHHHRHSSS